MKTTKRLGKNAEPFSMITELKKILRTTQVFISVITTWFRINEILHWVRFLSVRWLSSEPHILWCIKCVWINPNTINYIYKKILTDFEKKWIMFEKKTINKPWMKWEKNFDISFVLSIYFLIDKWSKNKRSKRTRFSLTKVITVKLSNSL